jgi:hypothetical protein
MNKWSNFIFNYLVQTHQNSEGITPYTKTQQLTTGEHSIANALLKIKDTPLGKSPLFSNLVSVFSDNNGPAIIKLFKMQNSAYELDLFLRQLQLYKSMSKNQDVQYLINNLAIYSRIQSGMINFKDSINNIIPYEWDKEIFKDLFNHLTSMIKNSNQDILHDYLQERGENIYDSFFRNNAKNTKLVGKLSPIWSETYNGYVNDWTNEGYDDTFIKIKTTSKKGKYEYLSKEENGKVVLFKKLKEFNDVKIINNEGEKETVTRYSIFQKVNALGGPIVEINPDFINLQDPNKPFCSINPANFAINEHSQDTINKLNEMRLKYNTGYSGEALKTSSEISDEFDKFNNVQNNLNTVISQGDLFKQQTDNKPNQEAITQEQIDKANQQPLSMSFYGGIDKIHQTNEPNKSMIQLIREGKRTQTSRDINTTYNKELQNKKPGDLVVFEDFQNKDKNSKSSTVGQKVLVRITENNIPTKSMNRDEFSKQEGWIPTVYDYLTNKTHNSKGNPVNYESTRFEYLGDIINGKLITQEQVKGKQSIETNKNQIGFKKGPCE